MSKIILVGVIFAEFFSLRKWFSCINFEDKFHFSAFDLYLRIVEAIYSDGGIMPIVVRIFHNKVSGAFLDFFKHVIEFWDIIFLINIFSFAGIFGFFLGLRYFFAQQIKTKHIFLSLIYIAIFQIWEIFFNPSIAFFVKLLLYILPYQFVVIYGYTQFFRNKNQHHTKIGIVVLLILLSILWYQAFPKALEGFCIAQK